MTGIIYNDDGSEITLLMRWWSEAIAEVNPAEAWWTDADRLTMLINSTDEAIECTRTNALTFDALATIAFDAPAVAPPSGGTSTGRSYQAMARWTPSTADTESSYTVVEISSTPSSEAAADLPLMKEMRRLTKHHHHHHRMLPSQCRPQYAWHRMILLQLTLPADGDASMSSPTVAQPDAVNTSPPSPAYDNTVPISDAMQQRCDTAKRVITI
jgi:hypothetical protein